MTWRFYSMNTYKNRHVSGSILAKKGKLYASTHCPSESISRRAKRRLTFLSRLSTHLDQPSQLVSSSTLSLQLLWLRIPHILIRHHACLFTVDSHAKQKNQMVGGWIYRQSRTTDSDDVFEEAAKCSEKPPAVRSVCNITKWHLIFYWPTLSCITSRLVKSMNTCVGRSRTKGVMHSNDWKAR